MLELAKNICTLEDAGTLLEEVIIVNNASTHDYTQLEKFIDTHHQIPFRYFHSEENLGVARGRNFAIGKSVAPILIMLDDDAELGNADCLKNLVNEYDNAETIRPTAIVSFKVVYFENGSMQENAFPHKKFEKYKDRHWLQTYYYAGGAHAIKRECLKKTGLYPEDFFYGMEEYDLSYRLINSGYGIIYSDQIVMRHKESPFGRQTKKEKLAMMWLNKTKVAWRYLPMIYYFSTAIMWSFEYLRKTNFHIPGYLRTWYAIMVIPSNEKRTPVSKNALKYLRQVEARLWY